MELEKIKEIVAAVLNVDTREITIDTTFMEDLGADSLDAYMIISQLEAEFNIEISAEDVEKITNVGEALELIQNSIE